MQRSGQQHPPPPTEGRGEVTGIGGGEFDLSTYFNSHHLHIPSKPILMFFIHLKPEVEDIGAGGGDRGGISTPPLSPSPGGRGEGVLYR